MLTEETERETERDPRRRYTRRTKTPLASTVLKDLGEEVQTGPGWHAFHCTETDKHENDDKHKSAALNDALGKIICWGPECQDGQSIDVPEFVSRNRDALRDAPYVATMVRKAEARARGAKPGLEPVIKGFLSGSADFAKTDTYLDSGYSANNLSSRKVLYGEDFSHPEQAPGRVAVLSNLTERYAPKPTDTGYFEFRPSRVSGIEIRLSDYLYPLTKIVSRMLDLYQLP